MAVTANDRACTVGQARASLAAADARGIEGWSRVNAAFKRHQTWDILMAAVTADDRDAEEILDRSGLTAASIRREFGVDGQKPGLRQPKKARRRLSESW